ncbi:MAG: hypothetical protein AAFN93_02645 [Bacteroidota bacterium]
MRASTSIITDQLPAVKLLAEIIDSLQIRLEKYISFPGAKQSYINRQNELLFNLRTVYESISQFKYLIIWQDIERIMTALEEDPQIAGHAILIRTRLNGKMPSVIDKYWEL